MTIAKGDFIRVPAGTNVWIDRYWLGRVHDPR